MHSLLDFIQAPRTSGEIVVDLFAGGGGASEGIKMAIGRDPDAAINHNPKAVSMHMANHPDTEHWTNNVWSVSPTWVTRGRPVGLLHASPDCTHFSKAKGGSLHRDEMIRSLARVLTDKWIPAVRPRVVIMENVEEFKTWCDLMPGTDKDGNPIYEEKTGRRVMVPDKTQIDKNGLGNLYKSWLRKFRRYGYVIEDRELRACDYGAPTIRKRLFIIARCDGQPIRWPAPTHGDPKSEAVLSGKLKPWRTAAECIDWSIPCPSIFATSEEIYRKFGVRAKRPLAEKTLKRIAEGIRRYVLETENPFVVNLTHGVRLEDVDEPMRTVTGAHRGEKAVVVPDVEVCRYKHFRGNPVLVASNLVKMRGTNTASATDEPLHTVSAGGLHHAEVRAFLVKYYSGGGQDQAADDPMHTLTTRARMGLVTIEGQEYVITDIGMRMLQPRELYRAQGFPDSYIIDRGADGKSITKTDQIKMCGNSVCPPVEAALVRANVVLVEEKKEAVGWPNA